MARKTLPPPKLNKAAAVSTRATVVEKCDPRDIPYILPLPKLPRRVYGFWETPPFEKKDASDHDEVNTKSKVPPHSLLKPYWGDVDNENWIHLFTEPSEDYSPIKLLSLDVMFKDRDEVSSYLIHLIHIFTK